MKPVSPTTARAFIEICNRVVAGIASGSITAEPGKEKQLRDLQQKAAQTLAMARQRREIR